MNINIIYQGVLRNSLDYWFWFSGGLFNSAYEGVWNLFMYRQYVFIVALRSVWPSRNTYVSGLQIFYHFDTVKNRSVCPARSCSILLALPNPIGHTYAGFEYDLLFSLIDFIKYCKFIIFLVQQRINKNRIYLTKFSPKWLQKLYQKS